MGELRRFGMPLVAVVLVAAGCGGSTDQGSGLYRVGTWRCEEWVDAPPESFSAPCRCIAEDPAVVTGWSGTLESVDSCQEHREYSCCLGFYSEEDEAWRCECQNVDNCQGEADSRPGTEIVDTCPPGGEEASGLRCAVEGQNCRRSYLEQEGLRGCCAGLSCQERDGIPVCLPGTSTAADCAPGQTVACQCDDGSVGASSCEGGVLTPCLCASSSGTCGNEVLEGAEECDGDDLGGMNCALALMDSGATGSLLCNDDCTLDFAGCASGPACGDGAIQAGEQCDGSDLAGATCASATMNAMPTGTLACSRSCTFDVSGCAPASF